MKFCVQCNEEFSALEPACPRCGSRGLDPAFLAGIPEPDEPPETMEEWRVVLRTEDEVEAQLAKGFLEAQDIEAMIYPDEGATGLERFGNPGLSSSLRTVLPGAVAPTLRIHLLVAPENAQAALEALRDLRAHPGRVEAADEEEADTGASDE